MASKLKEPTNLRFSHNRLCGTCAHLVKSGTRLNCQRPKGPVFPEGSDDHWLHTCDGYTYPDYSDYQTGQVPTEALADEVYRFKVMRNPGVMIIRQVYLSDPSLNRQSDDAPYLLEKIELMANGNYRLSLRAMRTVPAVWKEIRQEVPPDEVLFLYDKKDTEE